MILFVTHRPRRKKDLEHNLAAVWGEIRPPQKKDAWNVSCRVARETLKSRSHCVRSSLRECPLRSNSMTFTIRARMYNIGALVWPALNSSNLFDRFARKTTLLCRKKAAAIKQAQWLWTSRSYTHNFVKHLRVRHMALTRCS